MKLRRGVRKAIPVPKFHFQNTVVSWLQLYHFLSPFHCIGRDLNMGKLWQNFSIFFSLKIPCFLQGRRGNQQTLLCGTASVAFTFSHVKITLALWPYTSYFHFIFTLLLQCLEVFPCGVKDGFLWFGWTAGSAMRWVTHSGTNWLAAEPEEPEPFVVSDTEPCHLPL